MKQERPDLVKLSTKIYYTNMRWIFFILFLFQPYIYAFNSWDLMLGNGKYILSFANHTAQLNLDYILGAVDTYIKLNKCKSRYLPTSYINLLICVKIHVILLVLFTFASYESP